MSGLLFPVLLSAALLVPLFPLPQPAMHVNHPFKVELCVSIFLIVFFALARHRGTRGESTLAGTIAYPIAAFVLWSGISFFWGRSFDSVAHHTLLWAIYLIVFLLFTSGVWPQADRQFVITTFILIALVLGVLCIFDYLAISDFASAEYDIRTRYGKYAEPLASISPVLWAAAIYIRKKPQTLVILLAALFSWITVMLSLSKGAFLAGIVGFAVFFIGSLIFSSRLARKRLFVFAAIWLAVTMGTQVFFSYFSAVPSTTSYITGTADTTRSTTLMRVFTWKIARQMVSDHWLIGVGADNFGVEFNDARVQFRAVHPNDTTEEIAEDYIVERAHNEPLQVLTELGAIGLILFLLPLLIFGVSLVKSFRQGHRPSPLLWASLAGMAAFFVSSQFSSFSFRAAQNGVAFFMVFAVAVRSLKRKRKNEGDTRARSLRPVYLVSWTAILLMTTFCVSKVVAEYHAYIGGRSEEYSAASYHFRAAVAADREYAGAYLFHSGREEKEGNSAEAAQLTRKAIDYGLGISPVYSQLAKQQLTAGNAADAEATYREALSIYPRSIYLRMEFAVFLEDQGEAAAAAEQAATARSIDARQAEGWYLLIREGSIRTFYRARNDPTIAPPAELVPLSAVQKYIKMIPGNE